MKLLMSIPFLFQVPLKTLPPILIKKKDFQFIAILNILREQELETDESP